ncbi:hypothetical protein ThidrDRAFT_1112 [Thiorhodococcus drewsii AZ1]|uniref:Uncharacterized protein n=1 Tax=Thiorhodococcus drewsii AZ1 TaxID=765913 RepID=G2DYK0_9GAMM|nr:hypothetical protein [Thiorhodococcus drewsii]EGV32627.1 hypothetical protein ThidrDRAFT_1112 [Thiorhodococcus drewsii AZ1]
MLNVRDVINEHNCLTSVSAAYNLMQGQLPHPYLVKGQYFDVSLNGKSNDKHHLSFEQFVELLANPSLHPSARVRCKPNRSGTSPNGRRKLSELDWSVLRARLIEAGVLSVSGLLRASLTSA